MKKICCEKKCPICEDDYVSFKDACSKECIEKLRLERIKATKIAKYGSAGFNNREKAKQTYLEQYGVENQSQLKSVKEKRKKTNLEKYGTTNVLVSEHGRKKSKETCLEKFGSENVFSSEYGKAKIKESNLRLYGVENPQQNEEIRSKTEKTRNERYEGDLIGYCVKSKTEATCLEKFGNKSFFASDIGKMSYLNLKNGYGWTDKEILELSKKKDSSSFDWALRKTKGDIESAKQLYLEKCRLADSKSYLWALKKANGDHIEAARIFSEQQDLIRVKLGTASKSSLEVLLPIKELFESDVYIGIGGSKEFFLYNKELKTIYFYDFCARIEKVIIEFNGRTFHPKSPNQEPSCFIRNPEERFRRDQEKVEFARSQGFKVIVIWDDVSAEENIKIVKEELNYV